MTRGRQDVTGAELAVLQALWERGTATIRELCNDLYPNGTSSHYATVQKLLERLEDKRCVSRDRSGSVHCFQARVQREDLIGRRLRAVADSLCEGSLAPLLLHLVQAERLSPDDLRSLRELINSAERERAESTGEESR